MLIRQIGGFVRPFGVRAAADGSVFVADLKADAVTKHAPDGRVLWSLAGAGLRGPHSIALDGRGRVYLTEFYGRGLWTVDADGRGLRALARGGDPARPWLLAGPAGVRLDPEGALVVGDYGSDSLQKFSAEGEFLGWRGAGDGGGWTRDGAPRKSDAPGGFDRVHGAAYLPDGTMLVIDTWNHRLQRYAADGRLLSPIGGGPASDAPGRFHAPVAVAVEDDAFVVSEYGDSRLQRFALDGSFRGLVGVPGGFRHPYDVDARAGELFVADTDNARVVVVGPR